jgi:hypothetical protein
MEKSQIVSLLDGERSCGISSVHEDSSRKLTSILGICYVSTAEN